MTKPVRVLIVDDDALVRSGLTMMLGGADSVEVVGEAQDGSEVLGAIDRHRPDVLMLDHLAADGAGDERRRAADQLRRLSPRDVQIADAIAQGKANAVIAAELHLSVATIKSHVSAMLATLQLENRVQLALLVQDARRA